MQYSRDYLVHYYEIDKKRKLTIPSLIHYLEDIAVLNSEERTLTLDYYDGSKLGWMLIQWEIKIIRMPSFNETVTINTTPTAYKIYFANREYEIVDKEGNVLVTAKSVWLLADMETRKPTRVPDKMYDCFGVDRKNEYTFYKLEEFPPITEGAYNSTVKVRHTDLDSNDHVNNVKYIEWALGSLPHHCVDGYTPSRIRTIYRKELNLDEEAKVISNVTEKENGLVSLHSVYNSANICNIEIEWRKEN
jgi:medium-chain acyl-[acyl-carrier-protein] hydrolase